MKKVTKLLKPNELLSVFALGRNIELLPEPISGQPSLELVISFDAFLHLSRDIGNYGSNILSVSSKALQRLHALHLKGISASTRELQTIYMREVAYAIMKEISYSESRGKGVTKIRHQFNTKCLQLTDGVINQMYDNGNSSLKESEVKLISHMRNLSYSYPSLLKDVNAQAYRYAVVLFELSSKQIFNINATK